MLPPSLLDHLDFDRAVDRVLVDMKTDFISSEFESRIIERFRDTVRAKVIERVSDSGENGRGYVPEPLRLIHVPKRDYTIRSGAVPGILDRVYFQALCDAIAPIVDPQLDQTDEKVVFSYRLADPGSDKMFASPSESYAEFSTRLFEFCQSEEFSHVVEADVSAYFDHIYHHNLMHLLEAFGCDTVVVQALGALLRNWQTGVSYGLPQGVWPSDLLGNLYLHPLDSVMLAEGQTYVRYVDDLRVFTGSFSGAKRALLLVSKELGRLGLNLNSAKTEIHTRESFSDRLRPASERLRTLLERRRELLREINPYFSEFEESGQNPLDAGEIEGILGILREATAQPHVRESDVKFCLSVLFGHDIGEVKDAAVSLLHGYPHLTSYIINYLASAGFDEEIGNALMEFLLSSDNIYDWQEMWVLRYFFTAPNIPQQLRQVLRSIATDRNKNKASRCIAIHLLGEFGELQDWDTLKHLFQSEESSWVRTYLVLGVRKLPKSERNHLYKYWASQDWETSLAVRYVIDAYD